MKKEKQRIIDWMYQLDFFSNLWYAKKGSAAWWELIECLRISS